MNVVEVAVGGELGCSCCTRSKFPLFLSLRGRKTETKSISTLKSSLRAIPVLLAIEDNALIIAIDNCMCSDIIE